jgi:hypothetical protein
MTWNWDHRGRDEYFQYITAVRPPSPADRLRRRTRPSDPAGVPAQAQHASLPGGMALVDMIDGADKSPSPPKRVEP